jgi:hypothetical protein
MVSMEHLVAGKPVWVLSPRRDGTEKLCGYRFEACVNWSINCGTREEKVSVQPFMIRGHNLDIREWRPDDAWESVKDCLEEVGDERIQ